jgi:hypothetical protein
LWDGGRIAHVCQRSWIRITGSPARSSRDLRERLREFEGLMIITASVTKMNLARWYSKPFCLSFFCTAFSTSALVTGTYGGESGPDYVSCASQLDTNTDTNRGDTLRYLANRRQR